MHMVCAYVLTTLGLVRKGNAETSGLLRCYSATLLNNLGLARGNREEKLSACRMEVLPLDLAMPHV